MRPKTLAAGTLAGVLVLASSGCGTLLHPERKGQTGGRLDPGVVLLDGIGLFFFLIPGLVAFAVDLSNGTIYLPGGSGGGAGDATAPSGAPDGGWRRVAIDGPVDAAAIDRIVERELGLSAASEHEALRLRRASEAEARAFASSFGG